MKLFVVIAVAFLASSVSCGLFGRRKQKVLDIHIEKGVQNSQPGQAPVGQIPVGQVPLGFGYWPDNLPLSPGQLVPIDHHVQLGHVRVGVKSPPPGTKVPVGQLPHHQVPIGQVHGSISVPVLSQHSIQVVPVRVNSPYVHPQLVSVEPSVQAVQLLFKSASSPLLVRQKHFGSQGSVYQTTRSEDNPHILRHEVLKPVYQEVREVIQPYRSVTQEIKPVLEQVHTVVPRGEYGRYGQVPVQSSQQTQQRVHFYSRYQQPIVQEPISQEPISQEPEEPISQEPEPPTKGQIV